jgi:hypothetical protein
MSEDQLLDMLWNECSALNVVGAFAVHQSLQRPNAGSADVAALYAGQRRRTNAPIDYAHIVEAMVSMMEAELPEKPAARPAVLPGSSEPPSP